MSKIEKLVKDYSSQKLKEIIGQQSSSYSETFTDYAKDELIRRGEIFQFNSNLEKEVEAMNDNELKSFVEKEWNDYHLEYLEIARKEYIKRGFKNETSEEEPELEHAQLTNDKKRYPALRTIAGIYFVLAWIVGIFAVIIAFYSLSQNENVGLYVVPSILVGAFIVLGLLATSESIKVFIDIEENTRRKNE
jgi:hypothetical protein